MDSQQNETGPWRYIGRAKTLAELVVAIMMIFPLLVAAWNIVQTGLSAVIPAWLALVAAVSALALGFMLGRRPRVLISKKNKHLVRREYHSALWEVDKQSGEVDGPFCKTCLVRMNSEDLEDRYGRGPANSIIFVCRNPDCSRRGSITTDLPHFINVPQVLKHVYELYQAEERRQQATKHTAKG